MEDGTDDAEVCGSDGSDSPGGGERQARAPQPPTLGQRRDAKLAEDVRPVGVGGGEECVGIGLGEGLARVEAVHEGERAKPGG